MVIHGKVWYTHTWNSTFEWMVSLSLWWLKNTTNPYKRAILLLKTFYSQVSYSSIKNLRKFYPGSFKFCNTSKRSIPIPNAGTASPQIQNKFLKAHFNSLNFSFKLKNSIWILSNSISIFKNRLTDSSKFHIPFQTFRLNSS